MLGPSSVVTGPPGSAAIASGSVATSQAGAAILAQGGNAVDGILAAAFAGAVSEPGLSSLGGGGFCLVAMPDEPVTLWDFFVNTPGVGMADRSHAVFETVTIQFPETTQVFHAGWGSVATPGAFAGYLELHGRYGSLALDAITAPARHLAQQGTPVEPVTALDFELVGAALGITREAHDLYFTGAQPKRIGETLRNVEYGRLLDGLVRGEISGPTDPVYLGPLAAAMERHGGVLTAEDMVRYQVEQRPPLAIQRSGTSIWTNPPPSFGGAIVCRTLEQLPKGSDWATFIAALAKSIAIQRTLDDPDVTHVSTGTTHISVIDRFGGIAAMTMSIGTGSGVIVPDWGVQLNNMAGEEDLSPKGLHTLKPGIRMGSMMAPTLIESPDGTRTAFGTGGSERIRSTTANILVRLIDEGMNLVDAVAAPRVHLAPDGVVHAEPGANPVVDYPVHTWTEPDFYFGGVHCVQHLPDGRVYAVGDGRRGGHAIVV
jgi:gamma-glutamyltranspeptidase/glutathione hydrolase